nr:DUF3732 domain-containing protein [uncultured Desulfobulbus sp.]
MRFQLSKLILWSSLPDKEPRIVEFEPGKLNVITGASRTGKSAIIPIIDYCLASSKCSIPVDVIRDACSWFGVVIQLENDQLLLARKGPERNTVPSEMFKLRGCDLEIPMQIDHGNTTVGDVKQILNGLSGIPSLRLDSDSEGESGFNASASFRDLISFNFQPQNIVANQNVLFYKVESYQYRERLKNVFPFALGVITASILAKQHELKNLRRLLQQKEREFKKIKSISERWVGEVKSHVSRAVEYGIWPSEADALSDDTDYLISNLQAIAQSTDVELSISDEGLEKTLNTLKELRIKEGDLSINLAEKRNNKSELDRLQKTLSAHSNVSSLKRDRLKLSEWLLDSKNQDNECPVCGNIFNHDSDNLTELSNAFHQFELEAKASIEVPSAFYRELQTVNNEIRDLIDKLNSVNRQIKALEVSSVKLKKERYRRDEANRFIGALENSLTTIDEIQDDGGLQDEIDELNRQIEGLLKDVSEHQIARKKTVALKQISTTISTLLPGLDIEARYVKAPCELSITDLSLKISFESGVQYYLSEIGSGSNWIAYHIALTVALHRFFSSDDSNPVGSFVIYDQPSQVYFPRKLADEGKEASKDGEEEVDHAHDFSDEDVDAVRKIFKTIADAISEDKGRWQALILDHAPDSVWAGISNIHKVAEWRDGEKLIPSDWLA